MRYVRVVFLLILALKLMILPAYAGSEIATLIDMLHQNGTVSDAQYARLMAELNQNRQIQAEHQQQMDAKLAAVEPSNAKVIINGGGLTVSSSDGGFTTRLGGRLQLDSASYSGRPELGDGTEVRRAYVTLDGAMYHDWHYRLQYNFANTGRNGRGILDAYLDYRGHEDVNFRVGHFKEPFTLHEATSDNFVSFIERASISAFSPGRRMGVMAYNSKKDWTWAAGFFGESVSTEGGVNDEGWEGSTRVTFSPINEENRLIHLGIGANYGDTGGINTVRYSQRPESHVTDFNLVDTGTISEATAVLKWGTELAVVWGPFSAQTEYIDTHVRRDKLAAVDLSGWYFEAGYFFTGESRLYKKGRFVRPKPNANFGNSGTGAWQLALRYSTLDLNDGPIDGGEVDVMTVGLNWYPTPTLRFSANYVDVLEVVGGPNDKMEPNVFQVRSQWAF